MLDRWRMKRRQSRSAQACMARLSSYRIADDSDSEPHDDATLDSTRKERAARGRKDDREKVLTSASTVPARRASLSACGFPSPLYINGRDGDAGVRDHYDNNTTRDSNRQLCERDHRRSHNICPISDSQLWTVFCGRWSIWRDRTRVRYGTLLVRCTNGMACVGVLASRRRRRVRQPL